jgi:pimeloyl-ACP methyl ester carboxylesterase
VLLLHAIGRSPASLAKLERTINAVGFETLNMAYRSCELTLEQLAREVWRDARAFIDRNDGPLHIVTHSMGGLVARALITVHRPTSLGRVVMLGPPNQGSEIADLLIRTDLFRRIYGPAGAQLTTHHVMIPSHVDFPLGVIAGDRTIDLLCWLIIPGPNDGKVFVARTKIDGMADHTVVHATHTLMARNNAVLRQTIHFLRHGYFASGNYTAA